MRLNKMPRLQHFPVKKIVVNLIFVLKFNNEKKKKNRVLNDTLFNNGFCLNQ